MNDKVKALGTEARRLPPAERIALVEDVLDSLDQSDPRLDSAWAEEARDRLQAYRRGDLAARGLKDVIAKYRQPEGSLQVTPAKAGVQGDNL